VTPRTRLGALITSLRVAAGMNQPELAKKVKVRTAYISALEAGKRRNPSLVVLKEIAKALGVPVTELLK
jgi:transcriptional regulator with XRE-family HTH domain